MNQITVIRRIIKPAIFVAALIPCALLVWDAVADALGPNPVEAIRLRTGDWTLRFLLITLAVTPVRRLTGWNALIRMRRMLGLFAFFYAGLHLITYLWLDQGFYWSGIVEDVIKRPYITIGVLSFLLLVPLAATSTNGMVRRLGGKRWRRLHRLVYPAAFAGVFHFLWLVKADTREPLIYLAILTALMVLRLPWRGWRMPAPRPEARAR